MKKIFCIILILNSVIFIFCRGTTTFEFLKINPDTYLTSIGEGGFAFEGLNINNPAGLAFLYKNIVSVSYFPWLLNDIKYYNIIGAYLPPFGGVIGGMVKYLDYDIKYYDNSYEELNLPKSNEMLLEIFYSDKIKKKLTLEEVYGSYGLGIKLLNSNLAGYSAQSFALDFGVMYKFSSLGYENKFLNSLSLGLAVQDLGLNVKYIKKENSLPTRYSLGLCYDDLERISIFFDVSFYQKDDPIYSLGITLTPVYPIKTSFGWVVDRNSLLDGLRCGFSVETKDVIFEYSFVETSEFANNVNKIAIKYVFSTNPQYETYKHYTTQQLLYAKEHYLRKNYITAKNILEDILRVYPDYQPAIVLERKIDATLSGLSPEKQKYVDKCIKKVNDAIKNNNIFDAEKYYNTLLEIDPYNPLLAQLEEDIKKLKKEYVKEKVLKENRKEIEKLYKEGIIYCEKQQYEEAKKCFEEILKIYPEHKEAQEYIAKIDSYLAEILLKQVDEKLMQAIDFYNRGNYRRALSLFEEILQISPQRIEAIEYKKRCEEKLKEEMGTKQLQQQTIPKKIVSDKKTEKQEGVIYLKFDEATKLYGEKKYEDAISKFEEVVKLADEYKIEDVRKQASDFLILCKEMAAEKYFRKGLEYRKQNNLESAYESYKKSINYKSENQLVKKEFEDVAKILADKYYNLGEKYYDQGDIEKAKEMFKKSIYYYEKEETIRALEKIK